MIGRLRQMSRLRFCVMLMLLGGSVLVVWTYLWRTPLALEPVSPEAVYKNAEASIDARVEDLLARMTKAEKFGQMALVEKNSVPEVSVVTEYGLGALLSGAGAKPDVNTGSGWAAMIADYQAAAARTRLGIPLFYGADAVHGHALVPGATVFPHALGLGATNDPVLVERIGEATARELAATGVNWNYAPNLDLPLDIRWGRVYEALGDDSARVARLGAAYTTGLQTRSDSTPAVAATLKHYVGLGSMGWGTSFNKNFAIDQGRTAPDEVLLRDYHLPPFQASIEAGALSVMVGLNAWGDTKVIASPYLITDVLKGELGFQGFVVSDWYGVYENTNNKFLATVRAVNAGVDMVMLPFEYEMFVRHMTWANRLGLISDARIDDAVRRILRAKFTVGLFDIAATTTLDVLGSEAHRALARTAVAQSLVLLKNEADVLPVSGTTRTIRVAGSAADNVGKQSGAWTVEWQGVDGNWLPQGTSILAGIRAEASTRGQRIEYDALGQFATSTRAELGIAIVGESPYAEGWGDRALPILSNEDRAAIARLQATTDRVVIILVSGRPLLMAGEVTDADAVVAAWLPGTEGGGVADVLFGRRDFTGTLPIAWPKTSEQLPLRYDGTTADGSQLLFPSGFGLTYAKN
jgi:beta-glucosidase